MRITPGMRRAALGSFLILTVALAVGPATGSEGPAAGKRLTLSLDALRDKIKGGWAGQTIGCTYGGPTEFRFQGTIIQDYERLAWSDDSIPAAFKDSPGLYDDVYMDLTFVDVFEKEG